MFTAVYVALVTIQHLPPPAVTLSVTVRVFFLSCGYECVQNDIMSHHSIATVLQDRRDMSNNLKYKWKHFRIKELHYRLTVLHQQSNWEQSIVEEDQIPISPPTVSENRPECSAATRWCVLNKECVLLFFSRLTTEAVIVVAASE